MEEIDLNDPLIKAEIERERAEAAQQARTEEAAKATGLVEELKELRRKKGLDENGQPIPTTQAPDDIVTKIREVLNEDKMKAAEGNRTKALQKFYEQNKEFHPDNDVSGLKFRLIEDELKNFKTDGLYSEEDYLKLFNKSKSLVMNGDKDGGTLIQGDASNGSGGGAGNPRAAEQSRLISEERKLIEQEGWTEERYLTLKGKPNMAAFIEKLLKTVSQCPDRLVAHYLN